MKNRISNSKYMLFYLLWQVGLYLYVWGYVHMGACVHGLMFANACGSQRTTFSAGLEVTTISIFCLASLISLELPK